MFVNSDDRKLCIQLLFPTSSIQLKIRTMSEDNACKWFLTKKVSVPAPPSNLKLRISSDTVDIQWEDPQGALSSEDILYDVKVYKNRDIESTITICRIRISSEITLFIVSHFICKY